MFDYIRDPAEIYRKSFATVRDEAELSGLSAEEADLAVRLIHSCGMPEIAGGLEFSQGAVAAGKARLKSPEMASLATNARVDAKNGVKGPS